MRFCAFMLLLALALALVGCSRQAEPPVLVAQEVPGGTAFDLDEPGKGAAPGVGLPPEMRKQIESDPMFQMMRGMGEFQRQANAGRSPATRPIGPAPEPPIEPEEPQYTPPTRLVKTVDRPVKAWELNQSINSWTTPGFTLTLSKVELYKNHRTRWYFAIMNRSGRESWVDISLAMSFLLDAAGNRYQPLTDSQGTRKIDTMHTQIPDGVRFDYWIDWPAPPAGVTTLDVSLQDGYQRTINVGFRRFTVHLPEDEEEDETPKAGTNEEDGPRVVKAKTPKKGAPAGTKPSPFKPLTETFAQVKAGQLPTGWTAEKGNLVVKPTGTRPGLALKPGTSREQVTIPVETIGGRFHLECEFEMTDPGSKLLVRLEGAEMLTFGVSGDGQFLLQDKPKKSVSTELKLDGGKNLLILDRSVGYVAKVNNVNITFPISLAPGAFEKLSLTLESSAGAKSPVIRSLRIVPG